MAPALSVPIVHAMLGGSIMHSHGNFTVNQVSATSSKIWADHVATNALYDSQVNVDAGNCLAGTRTALIERFLTAVRQRSSECPLTWMHGPAGAGKSAIMRTVAERLDDEGALLGSFFFFHDDPQRNGSINFVITLAYQIRSAIPCLRDGIDSALKDDPLLLQKPLPRQLRQLILRPMQEAFRQGFLDASDSLQPYVVVVDGVDECGMKGTRQREQHLILDILKELAEKSPLPLTILLASRPERHLHQVFSRTPLKDRTSTLALDDSWSPNEDIRLFLKHEFALIRCLHILGDSLPREWPSPSVIEALVYRASGQFVYAATVVRFIANGYGDPAHFLEIVLGLRKTGNHRPFETLDDLYHLIFQNIEDDVRKQIIRTVAISRALCGLNTALVSWADIFPASDFKLAVSQLGAVASGVDEVYSYKIHFYHKSFTEFLDDPARSLHLYASPALVASWIICGELAMWEGNGYDRLYWRPPTHSLPAARRGPQFIGWVFKADPTEELTDRLDRLFSFAESAFSYDHREEWLAWTYMFFTAFSWKVDEIPLLRKSSMAPFVWPRLKKIVSLVWTHAFASRPPPFYISKVLYETNMVAGPHPRSDSDDTKITEEMQWAHRYLCNVGQGCPRDGDSQLDGAVFGILMESKHISPLLGTPKRVNPVAFSGLFVPLSALSFHTGWMPRQDFPTQTSILLLRWMKAVFSYASTEPEMKPKRKENRGLERSNKHNLSTSDSRGRVYGRSALPKRPRCPTLPSEEPEGHREVQRELIKFLSLASGSDDIELRGLRRARFKIPLLWLEEGMQEALYLDSMFKNSRQNMLNISDNL